MPAAILVAFLLWLFSTAQVSRTVFFPEEEHNLSRTGTADERANGVMLVFRVLAIATMFIANILWATGWSRAHPIR